jgi:hypothetical protein
MRPNPYFFADILIGWAADQVLIILVKRPILWLNNRYQMPWSRRPRLDLGSEVQESATLRL